MPLPSLNDEEQKQARLDVQSDLKWLLAENDVDEATQLVLHHFGIKKMRAYAGLGDTAEEIREMVKTQLGLDPATSMAERTRGAAVVAAWAASKTYVAKEEEKRDDHRSRMYVFGHQ